MEVYKGKNSFWLIVIFVIYDICPIFIYLCDASIVSHIWWILLWVGVLFNEFGVDTSYG